MHSYQHNIKTWNHATRHLTRVERALYRELTELYYDTEQPLPADNFERLCRLVLAVTEEEKAAVKTVLDEFFTLTGDVYTHDYCDEQIEKYRANSSSKAKAGRASAEARRKKAEQRRNTRSTGVEQNVNKIELTRNKKPITNNHKPNKNTDGATAPDVVKPISNHTPEDMELAKRMHLMVLAIQPKAKAPSFDKWANTIRLMREQDGRSLEQIERVFAWANRNDFWRSNILSPDALRRQLDKLELQMARPVTPAVHAVQAEGDFARRHTDTSWREGLA